MRSLIPVSVTALVWMLYVAPFVHVHSGAAGPDGEAIVHSHLPEPSSRAAKGDAFETEHDAENSIDLFASVTPRPAPLVVCIEAVGILAPGPSARLEVASGHSWRERGPPRVGPPLRAPPA